MPLYRALKDLPQGQKPGDTFDTTEAMGNVLVLVGAAERIEVQAETPKPTRRSYVRRDLTAEA